jgi:hypothetical protein
MLYLLRILMISLAWALVFGQEAQWVPDVALSRARKDLSYSPTTTFAVSSLGEISRLSCAVGVLVATETCWRLKPRDSAGI